MGNQASQGSKQQTSEKNNLISQSQESQEFILQHSVLSKCIHSNGRMILRVVAPQKKIIEQWQKDMKIYDVKLDNIPLTLIPEKIELQNTSICGTQQFLHITYPSVVLTLRQELLNRAKIYQPFTEQQLSYLLYTLLKTSVEISQNRIEHSKEKQSKTQIGIGDVNMNNILFTPDGDIRIYCHLSYFGNLTAFQKALEMREKSFIAPEQALQIQRKIYNTSIEPFEESSSKYEQFAIGLTILGAMLLHDEEKLYFNEKKDYESGTGRMQTNSVFDFQGFEREVQELQNCEIYSQFLRGVVLDLVRVNPQQRVAIKQIYDILKPYENQIVNFEQLSPQPKIPFQILKKPIKILKNTQRGSINSKKMQRNSEFSHQLSNSFNSSRNSQTVLYNFNRKDDIIYGNSKQTPLKGAIQSESYMEPHAHSYQNFGIRYFANLTSTEKSQESRKTPINHLQFSPSQENNTKNSSHKYHILINDVKIDQKQQKKHESPSKSQIFNIQQKDNIKNQFHSKKNTASEIYQRNAIKIEQNINLNQPQLKSNNSIIESLTQNDFQNDKGATLSPQPTSTLRKQLSFGSNTQNGQLFQNSQNPEKSQNKSLTLQQNNSEDKKVNTIKIQYHHQYTSTLTTSLPNTTNNAQQQTPQNNSPNPSPSPVTNFFNTHPSSRPSPLEPSPLEPSPLESSPLESSLLESRPSPLNSRPLESRPSPLQSRPSPLESRPSPLESPHYLPSPLAPFTTFFSNPAANPASIPQAFMNNQDPLRSYDGHLSNVSRNTSSPSSSSTPKIQQRLKTLSEFNRKLVDFGRCTVSIKQSGITGYQGNN